MHTIYTVLAWNGINVLRYGWRRMKFNRIQNWRQATTDEERESKEMPGGQKFDELGQKLNEKAGGVLTALGASALYALSVLYFSDAGQAARQTCVNKDLCLKKASVYIDLLGIICLVYTLACMINKYFINVYGTGQLLDLFDADERQRIKQRVADGIKSEAL